jgi:hypothetical protein
MTALGSPPAIAATRPFWGVIGFRAPTCYRSLSVIEQLNVNVIVA